MPPTTPTHVLTTQAVRWGIDTLGKQKLHPTLAPYLYLREQARAGQLDSASSGSREMLKLIEMPGHPTKPHYFPLISRGRRDAGPLATFWRASNIAGSWSPGSIGRQVAWLEVPGGGAYAMPDDHVQRALTDMLYGEKVSALALGAYFLRNDGFVLSGAPTADDLIDAFRDRFDYPADADDEFDPLFSTDVPDVDFEWFELLTPELSAQFTPVEEETNDV